MFNFTTQTVYNEISKTGANKNMWVASDSKKPALRIGNTRFDAEDIIDIQVKNPSIESLTNVTFDMDSILIDPDSTENEITARIVLYVGLSMNDQDSYYANDLVYKGKPLYIEFSVKKTDTADVVAKRVKSIADKYLLLVAGTEKIFDVTYTATAAKNDNPAIGTVTFTGVNGYQQLRKAILQKFDPTAKTVDCCSNQGEYVDVIIGVPVVYTIDSTTGVATATTPAKKLNETGKAVELDTNEVAILPGLEAFGDYNWIIHNLRLPTAANTNFWSPTKTEMPVVGQQYTQFIVRICKERDGISGEIVGARAKSVTTHVLYVAGAAAKNASVETTSADKVYKEFSTLLGADAATKIKSEADAVLNDPYRLNNS